ncbi:MAG: hypothetical protein PHW72_02230 [Candidatus Pacebacteria bacterium]|nr:hypothetical protein [Candidatus Paceibacterota bacterium]
MSLTISSFVFLFGTIVSLFLGYRGYKTTKRVGTTLSRDFMFVGLCFFIFSLITTIGSTFFANNSIFLKGVVIQATFLQSLSMAFLAHFLFQVKFPKISPWVGFFIVLILGIINTLWTALSSFSPALEGAAINWHYPVFPTLLRAIILLGILLPVFTIFVQQGLRASSINIRKKAFAFSLLFILSIFTVFLEFFLGEKLGTREKYGDVSMIFVYLGVLILFFFSSESENKF